MRYILPVLLFTISAPAAFAQGYDGLIAPPADEKLAVPPSPSSGAGYQGLMATPDGKAPVPAQSSEPKKEEKKPAITIAPGTVTVPPVKTADDLKMQSMLEGYRADIEASFNKARDPNTKIIPFAPSQRNNGMLPQEYTAKRLIDTLFTVVGNDRLPQDQRRKNARAAYEQLLTFSDGIKARKDVPDNIYLAMGMTPEFIAEEKEGNVKALARLDEALRALRPLQK